MNWDYSFNNYTRQPGSPAYMYLSDQPRPYANGPRTRHDGAEYSRATSNKNYYRHEGIYELKNKPYASVKDLGPERLADITYFNDADPCFGIPRHHRDPSDSHFMNAMRWTRNRTATSKKGRRQPNLEKLILASDFNYIYSTPESVWSGWDD